MEGEVNIFTDQASIQAWQMILAFVLPLVIAVIVRQQWSRTAKSICMFSVSFVATLGTMYLNGALNDVSAQTFVARFLTVVVATIAFYNGIWKPTGVAPAVEERT
jgi:glucan phosphoethanolaminetransferase (alkaline phosphatase superfamily)